MDNDLAKKEAVRRRKRVNAIKKTIRIVRLVVIIIPIVLSVILFFMVMKLNGRIDKLNDKLGSLKTVNAEQVTPSGEPGDSNPSDINGDDNQQTTEEPSTEEPTTEGSAKEDPTKDSNSNLSYEPYAEWTDEQQAIIDKYKDKGVGKTIYLTFDDGPSIYTSKIIDILDYYDVKATFFVIGKTDVTSKNAYKAIVDAGNSIGMHSYTHQYATIYASVQNFAEDLNRIRNLIYECTGVTSNLYRFPGGSSTSTALIDIRNFITYLDEQDIRYFDWNASCGDGAAETVPMEKIVTNIMNNAVKFSSVVALMHDSKSKATTVEGLPLLIETLLNAGFDIQPITDSTPTVHHTID